MNSEELKAYDLAVENHDRAMARVAELEREVAALKAQAGGVVLPERKDESKHRGTSLLAARQWNKCLDEVDRLNQQPTPAGDDAERAAFEAAAVDDNFGLLRVLGEKAEEMGLEHGDYIDLAARHAWKYWQARATLAQSERVPDVSAMARVLSDRAASACCVDPEDQWKIYGHEFIEDVRAMLAAPSPSKQRSN